MLTVVISATLPKCELRGIIMRLIRIKRGIELALGHCTEDPMAHFGKQICIAAVVGIAAALGTAHTAPAADLGSGPLITSEEQGKAPNQWTLSFTPYGWLPFLKGDQTVRGRTVELDVNPIEVFEHLERMPWMSYAEARRGPLALYNDIFYANLGIDASAVVIGRTPPVGVDFEQAVIEVGGAYQIAQWWSGPSGSIKDSTAFARYTAIDVLAGARYWHQDMAVNLAVTATLDVAGLSISGGRAIARQGDVDWVDPLVGFRIRHQLAPGQELMFRADVGGFDVGSKFSWNVLAAYSWDIAVRNGITYSGVLGYRALSVDYEKGGGINRYEYNVLQHGPIVGLTVKF
jgi:hypothetical protein